MRGRMAGIEMISYSLGPTAGQFRAGVMAAWTTLRFSLTFGGLACTGSVGAVAAALPSLWRFDARSDAHVAEVRALREGEESYDRTVASMRGASLYASSVPTSTFLVTVSGPDRIGVGAELFAARSSLVRAAQTFT